MSGTIENQVVPAISEEDEACLQAMLISTTHIISWVLKAATDLDLFGIIARAGPAACMTPTEIASQLPTQDSEAPSRLDRMLRLLASHSVLTCSIHTLEDGRVERLYGLTPASQFLFEREDRGSVACFSAFPSHRAIYEVSIRMKDAILEGGNLFKKVHGMPMFQYMDGDPTFKEMFFKIMDDDSTMVMKKILEVYQGFEGLKSLVDVGGGIGKCINMIISKNPTTKGINFDLPHVIQNAPSYPGIEHVGGDMFHNVPKGDAIMIKYILHDWSDEDCMKLLRNCYEALPNNGKVVIIELLMQEAPDSSMSSQYVSRLDNGMLLYLEGKERTEKEFEALCKGSGFSKFKVVCCAYAVWVVMEFHK
ncbi:caffeic acid 3-O-methyltransferase [Quercus suber]|uniref:caffeic acid 3-O-methyltransferase n=1 Tax=Quercus suber TaxID=58331 RepID=UPI0032DF8F71